jgi:hypothetical protein
MKLKELQKQFAEQLYHPQEQKIFNTISSGKIKVEDRIQIYRNNVFGSFDEVLLSIYPTIKGLVGKKYFLDLCQKYHQQYRSESGNLNNYGKYFSALIGSLKTEHKIIYLSDIAKLEWLYWQADFTKDVPVFDLEKLQKLSEQQLFKVKFKLHPSCVLLTSKYPIYSIWQSFQNNKAKKLDLKKLDKESILIERANWQTNIHHLLKSELLFLQQIKKGQNLYQIYQKLTELEQNFDIGSLLNKYISNGVLCSFKRG